jgi:hypothetical protein
MSKGFSLGDAMEAINAEVGAPSDAAGCYARPSTRAELRNLLLAGTPCEVSSMVAEWTALMLRGWLGLDEFTMRPSEHAGWVIFEA